MSILDLVRKGAMNLLVLEEINNSEIEESRLSTCFTCENNNKKLDMCAVCKCFIASKAKSKINYNPLKLRQEVTHCPIGKWGDKITANIYRDMDNLDPL